MTNAHIQSLIDAAASRGGGAVEIPPGVYTLTDAVHLRSNVRLVGAGPGVVFRKSPSVTSEILDFLGYGHYEFSPREPEKFRVGMGVHIYDKNAFGFYTTVGTIIDRKGDLFFINRPFSHDYLPPSAKVTSAFSLIEGDGVTNASVENISLDGNLREETFELNGCRGGGVFLIQCHKVTLNNLEVHHYRGDAISFQQCTDIIVAHCHVHDNTGTGLHPGSGSVRYLLQHNNVHDNGRYGLFYCLRTSHSICEHNTYTRNHQDGISVGERDTDHLIRNNTVTENGHAGIDFRNPLRRSGDRTLVVNNVITRNNTRNETPAEIRVAPGLCDIHIEANQITPNTGKQAVLVETGCERISVVGNTINGRPQTNTDVTGAQSGVSFTRPTKLPPVGPEALALDAVGHLHISKLNAWIGK